MNERDSQHVGCGCDDGLCRRDFLAAVGTTFGAATLSAFHAPAEAVVEPLAKKQGASVRAVFLYPPSKTFADDPDGWWSWPGNFFDAEGKQKKFTAALREMEKKLGMKIIVDEKPVANADDAQRLAKELQASRPDGLLLIMLFNRSLAQAELLLNAAEGVKMPAVFYIDLGVKHGPVAQYRRPGVYFIQSLENFRAIEYGMTMINAKKLIGQSKILSINEAKEPSEIAEPFLGTKVRVIPFPQYVEVFHKVAIDEEARKFITAFTGPAKEIRNVSQEALENAARAHFALKSLLAAEGADGVTMNCLRRGMLKPCISFATINNELIPAACENDVPAALTQLLGRLLLGRPGFQHNPAFETERNHYYASHCTCPTKIYGPDRGELTYILRRFAHSNEGSCAIQVLWKEGDPVTMVRYYPGKTPLLDVYSGKVFRSHAMPPAGGCCTNVEIEITDRTDACSVGGHHNLLFYGDDAQRFRLFAQLYRLRLGNTAFQGTEPV